MITLATLDQATAQEVFTQVKDHLLKQGERSMLSTYDVQCAYRGEGGKSCAAGCLMSDEEAKGIPEPESWKSLVESGYVTDSHRDLITELQDIHDDLSSVDEWPEVLKITASKHGLKY